MYIYISSCSCTEFITIIKNSHSVHVICSINLIQPISIDDTGCLALGAAPPEARTTSDREILKQSTIQSIHLELKDGTYILDASLLSLSLYIYIHIHIHTSLYMYISTQMWMLEIWISWLGWFDPSSCGWASPWGSKSLQPSLQEVARLDPASQRKAADHPGVLHIIETCCFLLVNIQQFSTINRRSGRKTWRNKLCHGLNLPVKPETNHHHIVLPQKWLIAQCFSAKNLGQEWRHVDDQPLVPQSPRFSRYFGWISTCSIIGGFSMIYMIFNHRISIIIYHLLWCIYHIYIYICK